jgi:hypothetical protein
LRKVFNAPSAFRLRSLAPILLLSAAGFAAPKPDLDVFRGLNSPWVSGWALADFDGDSQIDVATATSGRHDADGYAHEVSLRLSGVPPSSFIFRDRYAKVRLSARDMDGDDDRDLLILEASSMQPVGIWLNDGSGHFDEGDLADFRDALQTRAPGAFQCPSQVNCTLATSVQPALLGIAAASESVAIEDPPVKCEQTVPDARAAYLYARGPPTSV